MKKRILFFFAFLLFATSPSFAQFLDEEFDYPDGALISDYGWVPFSGIGVNPIHVCTPGLEFPCYTCVFGNAACLQSTGEDVYKFLHRSLNSGSVYVVFMVKITSAQSGDFFFHLGDSVVNNSNKIARVYAKDVSGQIAFGLAKDNESPTYTSGVYSTGVTYLLILKYTFVPAGNDNDLVSLFVFSPPNCLPFVEPAPTIGPLGVGEDDLPNVGKVVLQQGANAHAPTLVIDGICVFDDWDNGALPVELSSFTYSSFKGKVILNWTTSSEINNSGFNIERKSAGTENWNVIGNVNGYGTSNATHNYVFEDKNLSAGRYKYRLKQIDFNGNFQYFNLNSEVEVGTPSEFSLSQNYPNPFNPSTKINFELADAGFVSIKIFDNLGREVATLVNEFKNSGYYSIDFNASNLTSGLYFYQMEAPGFSKIMKMTLVK